MAHVEAATSTGGRLLELAGRLERHEGFAEVVAELEGGHAATFDGVWGSSCALVAAALAARVPDSLVVVCPHLGDVDDFIDDLGLFTPITPERFPARETLPDEWVIHDEIFGDRVRLLKRLEGSEPIKLVATSIQGLLEPVPDRAALRARSRSLRVGEEVEPDDVVRWLVGGGFHNTSAVELPGEFAPRGGILDVFAPDWFHPVRIEFFGNEIASIRRFEVATQRSLAKLDQVELTVLAPSARYTGHQIGRAHV